MRITTVLVLLSLGLSAQARIKVPDQTPRPKTVPAVYTLGTPAIVDIGTATEKAFNGEKVYKCQEVELTATKSGVSLKPVKELK